MKSIEFTSSSGAFVVTAFRSRVVHSSSLASRIDKMGGKRMRSFRISLQPMGAEGAIPRLDTRLLPKIMGARMAKRIDVATLPAVTGTLYPPPFDQPCRARQRIRLGDAAGLTQYGVNLVRLEPGAWSSQRHWHIAQDEFIYILSGEVTLVTDAGSEILRAGDCAGFKAGDEDGHHLQNNSSAEATFLEIGTRLPEDGTVYSDIDMTVPAGSKQYCHRDGSPYPKQERRGP